MTNKNNSEQTQRRVAFYLRVSTDDQVDKFGIDMQKSALIGLLQSKGKLEDGRDKMKLAGENYIYKDEGISGTIPLEERPGFARLKEDILLSEEGHRPFDIVAVYKIDRFARKLKILLEVIDFLEEEGIQFLSANESIDTSTPFGKAILGIVGVIAELEIETTKARTQAGRMEAIKKGVAMGAAASYGYTKDENRKLIILDSEAFQVKSIYEQFVHEGLSTQQIASDLTLREIPSPEASAVINHKKTGDIKKKNDIFFWRAEKIRKILSNELYIGNYYTRKTLNGKPIPREEWELSPHRYPSIVGLPLFERAQDLLKLSRQSANAKYKTADKHIYLLSGLLKCDSCHKPEIDGDELYTWFGDRKKIKKGEKPISYTYAYKCGRKNTKKNQRICEVIPIPADPLDQYIIEMVKELLKSPVAVYNYQNKLKSSKLETVKLMNDKEDIIKKLNALPSILNNILTQHELGAIDDNRLKERTEKVSLKRKSLTDDLQKVEYQLAQHNLSAGYIKTLKLFSPKYTGVLDDIYNNRQEVYNILHILIRQIIVYSRSIKATDVVAGRKKPNQKIPYKLELELKLPQDILNGFATGFGVKKSKWWTGWDSNPQPTG